MNKTTKQKNYSEEESKKWSQSQYIEAMKYCNKQGLEIANFDQPMSRVLPPVLAIWRVNLATQPKSRIWLVGGEELIMDHVDVNVAETAREALRHFSMSWQLKASQLEARLETNSSGSINLEQQQKVIATLISKAEALYALYANEKIWIE